jgi:signal transduction histidine kinase
LFFAAITAATVWYVLDHEMDEMMNQELREAGELIYHLTAGRPVDLLNAPHPPRHGEYEEHLIWQIIDTSRQAVVAKSHKAPDSPLVDQFHQAVEVMSDGQWHATTFKFQEDEPLLLAVAQSDEERREAKNEAVLYALLSAIVSALCVSLLLNWRIKNELVPLNQLSEQLRHIDPVDLAVELAPAQRRELQPIEDALTSLGQRLAKRLESEKAFAAHAAHALRTPLAGIDAQLAVASRESSGSVKDRLEQVRLSTRRVRYVMQALLSLFRSAMDIQVKTVIVAAFVQSLGVREPKIILKNPESNMTADTDLLAAVLFNLFDNSIRHGATTITVSLLHAKGQQHMRIEDDGHGCSAQTAAALNRAIAHQSEETDTPSTGLGLVLADLVMRSHHGNVQVIASTHGFVIDLTWPELATSQASILTSGRN